MRASSSNADGAGTPPAPIGRLRLDVRGAVQGVGFRPFAWRLARSLDLAGFVRNTGDGATVEVEGDVEHIGRFRDVLPRELPRPGLVSSMHAQWVVTTGEHAFRIIESTSEVARAVVLADQAVCADCLHEMWDPSDRRYLYPFINCTHCGPRFSIIAQLPYDRAHTTMDDFEMCAACRAEYVEPASRRYHAQPNACPECGPHARLVGGDGAVLAERHDAIGAAVAALDRGAIVAVKGIGGYHLLVDAANDSALDRLREKKGRTVKPFAVMVPTLDLARVVCELDATELRLLASPEAPIVLAARRGASRRLVAEAVAPGNPDLGLMLPYAPLHHLLLGEFGGAVVATSGNVAEEPICTDDAEARARLGHIADVFLVHNRRIARPADDSVVRVMAGQEVVLRRGRGYAPLPVVREVDLPPSIATGGHLKNAVAVAVGGDIVLSQHIGDLDSPIARDHQRRVARDLLSLFAEPVENVVCDLHPDYGSTFLAEEIAREKHAHLDRVQHHAAHLLACMADNQVEPPCLGVAWDGMWLGEDGTLMGGEFLLADDSGVLRTAYLRTFALVGGDAAARDCRRAAIGVLHECFGPAVFEDLDVPVIHELSAQERRGFAAALPGGYRTSSAGRLFDAVAALTGVCQHSEYEGHAACALEFAARRAPALAAPYPLPLVELHPEEPAVLDWVPLITRLLADHRRGQAAEVSAARFHATLAHAIARVAARAGIETVALTGGCFQNPTLLRLAVDALVDGGHRAIWHRQIPPGDGGLAAGQLLALRARRRGGE